MPFVYQATNNTDCVVTITGSATRRNVLKALIWSYTGTPTSGNITVTIAGSSFQFDIPTAGPGVMTLPPDIESTLSQDIVITLKNGGTLNKLTAFYNTRL